jgi:hypothetical protein
VAEAFMPQMSIVMALFEGAFRSAAAEGAVVELKMRLVAGKIPALQKRAHKIHLEDIEDGFIEHFGDALSDDDKATLRLCRELRNKVLHVDFQAARERLTALGTATTSAGVVKIDLPVVTVAEVERKIEAAKAGKEGVLVADTPTTNAGTILGWFLEAGSSGDFERAATAFKKAAAIVDRLADIEKT